KMSNAQGAYSFSTVYNFVRTDVELPTSSAGALRVVRTGLEDRVQVNEGDRLAILLGWRAENTSTTEYTVTLRHGGTDSTDLAEGGTDYDRPSWVELQLSPELEFVETANTSTPSGGVFDLSS